MKFVGVRDFRSESAKIWRELKVARNMVITSNGKPIAILSSTSEDKLEESISAIRRAQAMEALTSLRMQAADAGIDSLSIDEVNEEIKEYRRERKKQ